MSRVSPDRLLRLCAVRGRAAPAAALAQSGAASVTGLIVDETGGALPGVVITATNQASGVTYVATSNEAGNYTMPALLVGTYAVKAELAGLPHRDPQPGSRSRRGRWPGSTSACRSARCRRRSRSPPPRRSCRPSSTVVGEVISGTTVQSLPLNGRNTGQLALLLPGTITYNPRGFTNIGSVNMNRPFVNGNREQTNNFIVDGFDVNETIDNRVAYQPSPDALAEISVETNNYTRRHRQRRRRGRRQRDQVGQQPVPRQRLRVLPQQRPRREHLGEQPLRRAPSRNGGRTSTASRSAAR